MADECECGHVRDEHEFERGECMVGDCGCVHFDAAESAGEAAEGET